MSVNKSTRAAYQRFLKANPKAANPRSVESFMSIFEPLIPIELPVTKREEEVSRQHLYADFRYLIVEAIRVYERQDIVEAALIFQRTTRVYSFLRGFAVTFDRLGDKQKALKIFTKGLEKAWYRPSLSYDIIEILKQCDISKASFEDWKHFLRTSPKELTQGRINSSSPLYSIIDDGLSAVSDQWIHFRDMMIARPDYRKFFLASKISFATQPQINALKAAEALEAKMPMSTAEYAKYIEQAAPTRMYLKISDDKAWFFINSNSCLFEAKFMEHCATTHSDAKLFSLRYRNEAGQWLPQVTASFYPLYDISKDEVGVGYLEEIKGRHNSKPTQEFHEAIIALLLSDAVQSLKKSGYRPELDFQFGDLSPEQQARVVAVKPNINNFKGFIADFAELLQKRPALMDFIKLDLPTPYEIVDGFVEIWKTDHYHEFYIKIRDYFNSSKRTIIPDFEDYNDYGGTFTWAWVKDRVDDFLAYIKNSKDRALVERELEEDGEHAELIRSAMTWAAEEGSRVGDEVYTYNKVKEFISELTGAFGEKVFVSDTECAIRIPIAELINTYLNGGSYGVELDHPNMSYWTRDGFYSQGGEWDEDAEKERFLDEIAPVIDLIKVQKKVP